MSVQEARGELLTPEQEEQQRLGKVLDKINHMLMHLQGIPRYFSDDSSEPQTADEVAQQTVERLRDEQMDALRRAKSEPYFGRLDVQEIGERDVMRLYIGKRGVEDIDTGDRLVVDWRAPVSSIFYSFTGQGNATYEAPEGPIEADVFLKRNVSVRQGELQRVVDSYVKGQENVNVTDEFLLYRLTENKDSRLRDIVSTIQAEQDKIIRADRNLAIVIQGVAGSGKTTVALHRLAYLLYQHSDRMRTDRMVIFAPSAMFVDYISEVLPELGVGGIRQTTFAKWALQMLDQQVALRSSEDRMNRWFAVRQDPGLEDEFRVAQYKGSLQFRETIAKHLRKLENELVPEGDFEAFEGCILPETTIRNWFYNEYQHYPVGVRRERVLARVKRFIDTAYKDARADDRTGKLKKQSAARYRAYMKRWREVKAYDIYQMVLAEVSTSFDETGAPNPLAVFSQGKPEKRANRPLVDLEDLAPLLFIHTELNGVGSADRFDHVVIDEAQDFSPFQIALLKSYCQNNSFTILGDLSQSIHSYQGITDWRDFLSQFEEGKSAFFRLDVSYRSTMEIIEFANSVIESFDQFTLAKPVFRSGDPVVVEAVNAKNRLRKAVSAVRELAESANTVAVVCRSERDCKSVHAALTEAGIDAYEIDAKQQTYRGGISVLPVYLTKGLEFDAVLLLDVDEDHYDASALCAKLLYVGATRALHRLRVHTTERPSPLLKVEGTRNTAALGSEVLQN